MKFSTKEDIEAPAEFVFDEVSDFARFERAAVKRGVEVKRLDTIGVPAPGMAWEIGFKYRGKPRRVDAGLKLFDRPNGMEFYAESSGFAMTPVVTVVALSKKRTRLGMELEIRPRTMAARLMLQSLKLGKGNLSRRFQLRIRSIAEEIEARHARAQGRL